LPIFRQGEYSEKWMDGGHPPAIHFSEAAICDLCSGLPASRAIMISQTQVKVL
jgi:hypothetical protein